jgi:tetratricopeptide (TPR) repeat protein
MAFAQDHCTVNNVTVHCEKGKDAICAPKGDGTWDVECVPSNKTADQSSGEQQGVVPEEINQYPWINWRIQPLANYPLSDMYRFFCPIKAPSVVDIEKKYELRALAVILLEQGKYKEAEDAFNKEIQVRDNDDPCFNYVLALSQAASGQSKDAEATFSHIIPPQSLDVHYVTTQQLMGDVFYLQGTFPAAESMYRGALEYLKSYPQENADDPELYRYNEGEKPSLRLSLQERLVAALLRQRRYADAETLTEEFAKTSTEQETRTNDAWMIFKTGLRLLKYGKYVDAEKLFNVASDLDPANLLFREALECAKALK